MQKSIKQPTELANRIAAYRPKATRSELRLLAYLDQRIGDLPFETGASIAAATGVSAMTAGRLWRRLGYDGFDALKTSLRTEPQRRAWQAHDSFSALRADLNSGSLTADFFNGQVSALGKVFELTKNRSWKKACRAIVGAERVDVVSFQNIRGIAMTFAAQLDYARAGVSFSDGLNGTYSEILLDSKKRGCVIVVDSTRFAAKAKKIVEAAARQGLTVVLITDELCAWSQATDSLWLPVPQMEWRSWDSLLPLCAVLDLLLMNIVIEIGERADKRAGDIENLQDLFGDFSDD